MLEAQLDLFGGKMFSRIMLISELWHIVTPVLEIQFFFGQINGMMIV